MKNFEEMILSYEAKKKNRAVNVERLKNNIFSLFSPKSSFELSNEISKIELRIEIINHIRIFKDKGFLSIKKEKSDPKKYNSDQKRKSI